MTDKDIIKALECCTTNGASCKDCPAFVKVERSNCNKYFRGALALINRQQAKIERLKSENEKQRLIIKAVDDNCFPLPFETDYDKAINIAKAEAYKEFAERLKVETGYLFSADSIEVEIDNLVKEMIGE